MAEPDRPPTRRRVLALLAAAPVLASAPAPAGALRRTWRGTALGADAEIVLEGGEAETARAAVEAVRLEVERLEAVFSLFRADSALSRLNRTGRLDAPPHDLVACLAMARDVHRRTGGRFDPTVQPLFEATAAWFADHDGPPPPAALAEARAAIGFGRVAADGAAVVLPPGVRLTLNGVAQGWIADRAAGILAAHGFAAVLADLGEIRAGGPPARGLWRVGLRGGGERTLAAGALAVSAPDGLRFRGGPYHHLFDPLTGRPADLWQRIVVTAPTAAEADALATGLASAPPEVIAEIVKDRNDLTVAVRDQAGREFVFG
ncbi:FAD:protein FMN transferase [Prosthecomicrobium sp. N25]|uniref:FAD:protein FMN transferase n=1 Tax=Prosthecomicrobium sp. N25 TaxID=3129254 RepID=UPI003077DAC3